MTMMHSQEEKNERIIAVLAQRIKENQSTLDDGNIDGDDLTERQIEVLKANIEFYQDGINRIKKDGAY